MRQDKLRSRFPRTQHAIRHAATVADVTLMFDNSGTWDQAWTLARFSTPARVRYDIRDDGSASPAVLAQAEQWLSVVAPR